MAINSPIRNVHVSEANKKSVKITMLLDIFGFAFGKYQVALCSKRQSTDLKPETQDKICRRRPNKSTLFENVQ
jgi:hypothetical protein